MAELPGNSQKPLAFGTICPAAFLLSLIRKEWGWMQSTSSPSDVMRLSKLDLLYSISTPSLFLLLLFFSFCLCFFLFLIFRPHFVLLYSCDEVKCRHINSDSKKATEAVHRLAAVEVGSVDTRQYQCKIERG